MTLRIGITGGIGSGKTTAARIFEVLGVPVYYADDAAKRIMNEDEVLKQQIIHEFGAQSYIEGKLNREYLASIVFKNKKKLAVLNALVHPATIRNSNMWMKKQTGLYAIREAALIFESGAQDQLDYVIGVSSPVELRIERAMQRDKLTREQVMERMDRQINETIKMRLCDFVIVNDGIKPLIAQVLKLHEKFTK
ncbi:MAG: dephospho-CoA kinase [Flavitalea sp.]